MGVDHPRDRDPAARELLDDHRVGRQVEPHPAVLLGDRHPEQPELLHLLDDRLGELVLVVVVLGLREDLLVDELADHLRDGLLLVGLLGELRGGQCHGVSTSRARRGDAEDTGGGAGATGGSAARGGARRRRCRAGGRLAAGWTGSRRRARGAGCARRGVGLAESAAAGRRRGGRGRLVGRAAWAPRSRRGRAAAAGLVDGGGGRGARDRGGAPWARAARRAGAARACVAGAGVPRAARPRACARRAALHAGVGAQPHGAGALGRGDRAGEGDGVAERSRGGRRRAGRPGRRGRAAAAGAALRAFKLTVLPPPSSHSRAGPSGPTAMTTASANSAAMVTSTASKAPGNKRSAGKMCGRCRHPEYCIDPQGPFLKPADIPGRTDHGPSIGRHPRRSNGVLTPLCLGSARR